MAKSNDKQEIACVSNIPSPQVTQSHPWLVMCGGVEKEKQIFFSVSKGRYYATDIPELVNKKIFSNWMEWLVLGEYGSNECLLFNIITMEKIKLPTYTNIYYCFCCNLNGVPGDPNCRIVFVDNDNHDICICQPGDDKFIIKGKVQFLEEGDEVIRSAICFDGSIFIYAAPSHSLIRATSNDDSSDFEFQTVISGKSIPKVLLSVSTSYYLTESCEELLLVAKSHLHEEGCVCHVYRAEFSTSKWMILSSIGDRAIFLEPLSRHGLSCAALEIGVKGNCIYYTEEESRNLYVFNMEDKSLKETYPCPIINASNLTTHWVMIPSNINQSF